MSKFSFCKFPFLPKTAISKDAKFIFNKTHNKLPDDDPKSQSISRKCKEYAFYVPHTWLEI